MLDCSWAVKDWWDVQAWVFLIRWSNASFELMGFGVEVDGSSASIAMITGNLTIQITQRMYSKYITSQRPISVWQRYVVPNAACWIVISCLSVRFVDIEVLAVEDWHGSVASGYERPPPSYFIGHLGWFEISTWLWLIWKIHDWDWCIGKVINSWRCKMRYLFTISATCISSN